MSQIDWIEISRQVPGFIFGLFSGLIIAAFANYLTRRREKERRTKEVVIKCDLVNRFSSIYFEASGKKVGGNFRDFLRILVINISQVPITLIDVGLKLNDRTIFDDPGPFAERWTLPDRLEERDSKEYLIYANHLVNLLHNKRTMIESAWIREVSGETFTVQLPADIKQKIEQQIEKESKQ